MSETEEEALESARNKILKAQFEADHEVDSYNAKRENFQPHHVTEDEPDPLDDKLRVDQIQSVEGRVLNTAPMMGTSSVRPISTTVDPVQFADALEQWRYMSEKYRDRRLAKEKEAAPKKTENSETDTFNEKSFQKNYENDFLSISESRTNMSFVEEDKILKKLSAANLEIVPELIVEPDPLDIEPQNGILTVADVMTVDVISVIDSMTIEQVASIFNKKKITGVPVVNYHSKELIGIITMSDIVARIFESGTAFSLHEESHTFQPETITIMDKKVSELMKTNIIRVSASDTIKDACNIMLENRIHRVLVTKNNRISGIFTSFDAVRILAKFDLKIEKKY